MTAARRSAVLDVYSPRNQCSLAARTSDAAQVTVMGLVRIGVVSRQRAILANLRTPLARWAYWPRARVNRPRILCWGAKISVKRLGSKVILALIRVESVPSGSSVTTSLPHTGGRR